MFKDSIVYNREQLRIAVRSLAEIRHGTKYQKMRPDVFMLSDGETAEEVTELFMLLKHTEMALIELVEKTIDAMEAAGVSFEESDSESARRIEEIAADFIF